MCKTQRKCYGENSDRVPVLLLSWLRNCACRSSTTLNFYNKQMAAQFRLQVRQRSRYRSLFWRESSYIRRSSPLCPVSGMTMAPGVRRRRRTGESQQVGRQKYKHKQYLYKKSDTIFHHSTFLPGKKFSRPSPFGFTYPQDFIPLYNSNPPKLQKIPMNLQNSFTTHHLKMKRSTCMVN